MRILYVGDLRRESSTYPRFKALQAVGNEVVAFASYEICASQNRLLNFLGHRYYCTRANWDGNMRLRQLVRELRPHVVWIDKGRWIYPRTLRVLRAQGAKLVHYNTDDIYDPQGYAWLHRLGIRHYDLCITTNRFNVSEIISKYGVTSFRAGMGYDADSHRPPAGMDMNAVADVVFVGHWEQHTESYLAALHDAGLIVRVHGGNWRRARRHEFRKARTLPQTDYNAALTSAKLAICSLSRRNRNESTGRSFEIPAIGACLVAEDTVEHRYFYQDGQEAFFFRGIGDLVAKCNWLVGQSDIRRRVAAAGRRRCLALGLSWQDHINREWPLCDRFLQEGSLSLKLGDDAPFWSGFRSGLPCESTKNTVTTTN
jgi:hypothetical protein